MSPRAQTTFLAELAAWSAGLAYGTLPRELTVAARQRVLDHLGSALWGVHAGTSQSLRDAVALVGGAPQATVFGLPGRMPAVWATYLNSAAAPALLDTCRFSETHPGIVVIPAAIAVGELEGTSGCDVLAGIVVGYEVMVRLARSMQLVSRGFDPTGVVGAMAAAAAASRVIQLDARQTGNALALAATMGGGLMEAYGAVDSGRQQYGRTSQGGVWAALLARQGTGGNPRILEGGSMENSAGFMRAYGGAEPAAGLLSRLGEEWALPRVGAKIHDGCRYTNAAADAVLALAAEHRLEPGDVRRVRIATFENAIKIAVRDPQTVSGAIFSLEFAVAMALRYGDVFTDRFTLEHLDDPRTRELMARVEVQMDADLQKRFPAEWPLRLMIDTVDGRHVEQTVAYPRGEPELALSNAECESKFRRFAHPLLNEETVDAALWRVKHMDELEDVSQLTALLRPPAN